MERAATDADEPPEMSCLQGPSDRLIALEDQRLHAVVAVATAVAAAHELRDVLEAAAEVTRETLGVSSVSISRWELEQGRLRTLINVGDLGPGEERWPSAEVYDVEQFPAAHRVLRRGEAHITSVTDPAGDPAERALLDELGKTWCAATPITVEGATWGELYVTRTHDMMPITTSDVRFMEVVGSQIALAVVRAQAFSELRAAAYRDPLTGLPNRRAVDERLQETLEGGDSVVVVLGDVNGLKAVNDRDGHDAGDRALQGIARALEAATTSDRMLAGRIGGDEFCIVMERATMRDARALIRELSSRLRRTGSPVSVAWGAAATAGGDRTAARLMRAADAAQYVVKARASGSRHRRAHDGRRRHRA